MITTMFFPLIIIGILIFFYLNPSHKGTEELTATTLEVIDLKIQNLNMMSY
jgi:hypothetical protein